MKEKISIILLMTIAFLLASCQPKAPRRYDPSMVNFQVEYNPVLEGLFYPSVVLGLAGRTEPLPDEASLFTVNVTSPANKAVLRITIDSSRLNYVTTIQEELPVRGQTYTFHPMLKWKYTDLYNLRQQGVADLTFTCFINDEQVDLRNVRLNYRSANECIISLTSPAGQHYDFRWLFAGYVNEDHPYIDSILTQILDMGVVSRFAGYQQGERAVSEQVFAFWYYALNRGISYSSISCTSNPSRKANVQRIRFFDEVYSSRQANCLDACVFFASLIRKIGLKPVIFVEPCHAYLGYYTDRNRKNIKLLETTITAWVNFPELERHLTADGRLPEKYYKKVTPYLNQSQQQQYAAGKMTFDELKMAVARNLFDRATTYDEENYKNNLVHFADTSQNAFQQLDIEQLRRVVQPIN